MSEVSNADRAEWAQQALEGFVSTVGSSGELQSDIKDLMTDLLHLARRECGVEDATHFATLAAEMHDAEVIEDAEE